MHQRQGAFLYGGNVARYGCVEEGGRPIIVVDFGFFVGIAVGQPEDNLFRIPRKSCDFGAEACWGRGRDCSLETSIN